MATSPVLIPSPVLILCRFDSPIGEILAVCRGPALCALEFADCGDKMLRGLRTRFDDFGLLERSNPGRLRSRLRGYFAGDLTALDEIPVDGGGTGLQRREWRALRRIPPGQVMTYGELAKRLGIPRAVRAVAHANALNPISIVVPCHRLIGADGALRGYSGGLARKRWLLEHEGVRLERSGADR